MYNETIDNFEIETVRARQQAAFNEAGVPLPVAKGTKVI